MKGCERMNDNLKCPVCGSELRLDVSYDGCDWECIAGENSNFDYEIRLLCDNSQCGRIYPIGRIKHYSDFSEVTEKHRKFK